MTIESIESFVARVHRLDDVSPHEEAYAVLNRFRAHAHQTVFAHRHGEETPHFHTVIIDDWHSAAAKVLTMAFREAGKSTIAEEAMVLMAGFRDWRNGLILGSTVDRAIDRLRAIKHEIENNEDLIYLFGELKGDVWNEAKIVLTNGVVIQAFGRGQSLRGVKHLQWRPDFCFADDIEEPEHVTSPEARRDTLAWFMSVVLPALDKTARIRVNATPLDRDALPITLSKQPEWVTRIYPIEYTDVHGDRRATWPSRYPLSWVDAKRSEMERVGLHDEYQREYMCEAEDPKRKIFTTDMFVVKPRVRSWEPTFAMLDPARTTKDTSSTTGWAVWSWIANRMIVWDGGGGVWKPDEIVNKIFDVCDTYQPVCVGVEQDGLEEFLMQPIRHEQLRRGILVPVRGVRAPRGKLSFIEALQPYFRASEITFAQELPELVKQFLGFPSGKIDGPNALAFSKHRDLFPGAVVYDGFSSACAVDDLLVRARDPVWLCLNSGGGVVTAVAVQLTNGGLNVVADYVREGDPGSVVHDLLVKASVEFGSEIRLAAGPKHFADYSSTGLRGAVAKIPADLRTGASEQVGRDELRALFQKQVRDRPALLVSTKARWTINGFAAGYAYEVDKRGQLADEARPGIYRTLMEGLEAFAGLMQVGMVEAPPNIRYTEGGRPYVSSLPSGAAPPQPSKSDPWGADVRNYGPSFLRRR